MPAMLLEDADCAVLIGPVIDHGSSREVFCHATESGLVVKRAINHPGANFVEANIWNAVESKPELAALFGPCVAISESGKFLIMEKLTDLDAADEALFPPVPDWVSDLLAKNVGKNAAGNLKIRDYGMVNLSETLAQETIDLTALGAGLQELTDGATKALEQAERVVLGWMANARLKAFHQKAAHISNGK